MLWQQKRKLEIDKNLSPNSGKVLAELVYRGGSSVVPAWLVIKENQPSSSDADRPPLFLCHPAIQTKSTHCLYVRTGIIPGSTSICAGNDSRDAARRAFMHFCSTPLARKGDSGYLNHLRHPASPDWIRSTEPLLACNPLLGFHYSGHNLYSSNLFLCAQ